MPEVVVEGEPGVSLDEALVLDDVADSERLSEAHERGTPVVVRASSEEAVLRALERPEVACVLVPPDRAELKELDFRRLRYGA